jgi:hypothetical protein
MLVVTAETIAAKCARSGCDSRKMQGCSYQDRDGNVCITQWCMDHVKVVDGAAYCPRHAGVIRAITRSSSPDERPPVRCRAPSLAAWFAHILDPQIDAMVSQLVEAGYGHQVVRHGLSHRIGNVPAHHHWEQHWQVQVPERAPVDILIDVREEVDIVVRVRVNEVLVTRIVPPWIEQHQNHSGKGDEDRIREEFCHRIISLLGQSLEVNLSGPAASNWMLDRVNQSRVV